MAEPFRDELAAAKRAAAAASLIIARHGAGDRASWEKAHDSPVTAADLEADAAITAELRSSFPDDATLSEETVDSPERARRSRVWIVDPLDGTKEFIRAIPEYAVSIALCVDGEPVVGVVQQPQTGECFWGARGSGAWLDGERIRVSRVSALADCVVLGSRTESSRGQLDAFRGWFRELRPVGSVALKLAWTAAGRGDLWLSMAPKSEWDVCAGDLLLREAGGIFVTPKGPRTYNQSDVLLQPMLAAGPRELVEALLERRRSLGEEPRRDP